MIREIDASSITPDKLLTSRDMARLGCNDCAGCSDCCRGRAAAITLDPCDIRLLKEGLNLSFEGMLSKGLITLTVSDGIVLPALSVKNAGDAEEECIFLNAQGRCSIHRYRPGICRMFPLARLWKEDGSFSYFMQEGECSHSPGVKIRISKWLGYPNIREYEEEIRRYHDALVLLRSKQKTGLPHEEQVGLQRQFLETWFL